MRILPALLLLAACDRAEPAAEAPVGTAIACATGGAQAFASDCIVQRTTRDGRVLLTLVAADGGFRRLEAGADGRGIDTADGAAHARTHVGPAGEIAVEVGGDRYRLPASPR